MSQDTQTTTPTELRLNPDDPRERQVLLVEREFSLQQRKAKALAASGVLPHDYQLQYTKKENDKDVTYNNPKAVANCMVAMEMAQRLGVGELEVMQNLDVIYGRPSFRSTYLIAMVNKSGILKGRLKFRMTGEKDKDSWGCIAYGTCAETGDVLEGPEVTIAIAKAEGWYSKNGSKWKTMPELMLQYRAAAFWSRLNAPDATMGMHTTDEVTDITEREVNPAYSSEKQPKTSDLNAALRGTVIDGQVEDEPEPESEVEDEAGEADADQEQHQPSGEFTYAEVADAINKAEDADALVVAADMVREVKNKKHRKELADLAASRDAELSGETGAEGSFTQ